MSVPASLARLPLFANLTEEELGLLKEFLRTTRLNPGEILFEEGEPARLCYIVLDGTVEVSRAVAGGKVEVLAAVGSGALVGHVALIDGKLRSATCRAGNGPVFLIVFPGEIFEGLFNAGNTFAFKILDRITVDLVRRLRKTTSKLAEVTEEDLVRRTEAAKTCAREAANEIIYDRNSNLGLTPEELDEITFGISDGQ